MKTITKLAASNLRQNRTRSILIALSVFLSTFLLTVIAEFGNGLVSHNRANAGKIAGNFCGQFNSVTEEQYGAITKRSEFIAVGRMAKAAEAEGEGAKLGLLWMDPQAAENVNLPDAVAEGRLPEAGHELAASKEFFEKAGFSDPKLGDTVTLSVRRDLASKFMEQEFTVCGILRPSDASGFQKSFQGYVSGEFYGSLFPEGQRSYTVNFRLNESVAINADIGEEVLKELGALCGIEEQHVSKNHAYLMWAYDPGTETMMACIGISLIVILVSVVVIYNIFQVGIVQKIQEYGKIKALGATKKQLKQLIFREGMALAAIGIPLGLATGSAAAVLLFRQFVLGSGEMIQDVDFVQVNVVSVPVLLLAALIAWLTVWLALKKPMRLVASISPVEAVRYQENTKAKRAARKGKKNVTVLGMTCASLQANRKRTLATILTMGLSCVLFVVLSNFAGNIDVAFEARAQVEYGQFFLTIDYSLADKAYPENNLGEIQKNNPLGKEFQEKLKSIPGVTKVWKRALFPAIKEENPLDEDSQPLEGGGSMVAVCVLDREEFELYGISGALGTVDYGQVAAEDGILYGYSHFLEQEGYTLGEEIKLEVQAPDGKALPFTAELVGSFGHAPAMWAITEDTWEKINAEGEFEESLWVDCEEQAKQQVEAQIRELAAGMPRVQMETYSSALSQAKYQTRVMRTGIYAFIGIVGLIGFLNLANTIITGIVTRKRELGVLQAVGMTNRQLNQMLQLEGILFSAGTAAVSLAVGCPLGYAVFQYAKKNGIYGMNHYHVPVPEIALMLGTVAVLQGLLSYCLSRNLRKESLVERINYHG